MPLCKWLTINIFLTMLTVAANFLPAFLHRRGRGRARQRLKAIRRHLHVFWDVAERVPLGDGRGRVPQQLLDDARIASDLIHGGSVAVTKVVGTNARDPELQ